MKTVCLSIILLTFYSTLFAGIINVKDFGATGNGTTDDTKAIQKAIDAAPVNISTIIYFPEGQYKVGQYHRTTNYFENYCLLLHSNLEIKGDGEKTVIRLADHIFDKKDTAANAHLFYGKDISNIVFTNLLIDMNGSKNFVPENFIKNHCAIFAIRGSNYRISNIQIKNCAGRNMVIIMGNGDGLIIENSKFINGGSYVGVPQPNDKQTDFSFLYTEWHHSIIRNNLIQQENIDIALTSYSGGVELHGNNSLCTDDTIIGCWPAIYISSQLKRPLTNVTVQLNSILDCEAGIIMAITEPTSNIIINNNDIRLTHSRSPLVKGITGIYWPGGNQTIYSFASNNNAPIENLQITENNIYADSMSDLSSGVFIHSLQNSKIENNVIAGMNYGGIVLQGSKWGTRNLKVTNNSFENFRPNYDKHAVAGFVIITDTYTKKNNGPGFNNVTFSNNNFEKNDFQNLVRKSTPKLFVGKFLAVPGNMMNKIHFYDKESPQSNNFLKKVALD